MGGPIGLVRDGDVIEIDAERNSIELVNVSEADLAERRKSWVAPPLKAKWGHLKKYSMLVQDASKGAVTDVDI